MRKKKEITDRWLRPYVGFTMEDVATRPGSLDIFKRPSKMGNWLYYPNGEIKDARLS